MRSSNVRRDVHSAAAFGIFDVVDEVKRELARQGYEFGPEHEPLLQRELLRALDVWLAAMGPYLRGGRREDVAEE